MKKIEFSTLQMTINHAKQFGGWIFHNEKENISIWYDAVVYTMTMILKDSPTSGTIGMWSHFENKTVENEEVAEIEETQTVKVLDKKVMKKVNELVSYCKSVEFTYTQEEIIERYNQMFESNGEEAALNALEATLKNMKKKAKDKENQMWAKVKSELFKKNGFTPSAVRDLKSMIKNKEININGIESQNWVEKQLGIGA